MVHYMKYRGYWSLARTMAELINRLVSRPANSAVLVPVPLGQRRLRQRGYNQAAEIAGALADLWGMPLALDVLKRTRETKTQTKLTPEERTENVSGAFTAAARLQCRAEVILVDDVLTTGATLVAAAGALVEVGWADVTALTFARAMPLAVQIERA